MARRTRPGIAALLDVVQARDKPNAFTCGYALGPRINAAGRISQADLGLRLLLSDDRVEALALAERLDAVNRQRQEVEASMHAGRDARRPRRRRRQGHAVAAGARRGLASGRCRHRRRADQGAVQPPGLCRGYCRRPRQGVRAARCPASTWAGR